MTYDEHASGVAARVASVLGAASGSCDRASSMREVYRLLRFVAVPERVHIVIPAIHDLWSAHQLTLGFRAGAKFEREALRHDMLKSLARFSSRERRFDEELALGDTSILRDAVAARFRVNDAPAPRRNEERFDERLVAAGVAYLCKDPGFVRAVADPIHRHWQRTRRRLRLATAGDRRLSLSAEGLDPAARELLEANIRVDLSALVLVRCEIPLAVAS